MTIITHGFQPKNDTGDSLMPLAEAIHNRFGGHLVNYTVVGGDGGQAEMVSTFQPGDPSSNEVILLFDWAPDSNERTHGWGEAAGEALFTTLVRLGLVDPAQGAANDVPLHFIAHSFGSGVTGVAVERLARYDVPVEQVTLLDPHDFDQGLFIDGLQQLFTLGHPPGYGATV